MDNDSPALLQLEASACVVIACTGIAQPVQEAEQCRKALSAHEAILSVWGPR